MRFLSILFNPIGNLIWWIAKTLGGGIDRRLGPKAGWLLAFVLVLLSALTLVGAVYATGDNILKLTGMARATLSRLPRGGLFRLKPPVARR